jgi:hypothetical protein
MKKLMSVLTCLALIGCATQSEDEKAKHTAQIEAKNAAYRAHADSVGVTMDPSAIVGCESKGLITNNGEVAANTHDQAIERARYDAYMAGANVLFISSVDAVLQSDNGAQKAEASIGEQTIQRRGFAATGEAYLCP